MTGQTHTNVEFTITLPFHPVQGLTDKFIASYMANWRSQDIHIDRITLSLGDAPTAGQSVTLTVSDGIGTMTVSVTSGNTSNAATTGNFDVDVSANVLTVKYTTTANSPVTPAMAVLTCHTIRVAA